MKQTFKLFTAALVGVMLSQTMARASSHREAPLISNDPLADNTDVYAFRSPCDSNNIVLIANYIPFEHPAGGPNWYTFGENIRYEIHIDNNTATPGDDIIYRFTFDQADEDPTTFFNIRLGKQNRKTTYTLRRSTNGGMSFTTVITNGIVPPPNIGPRSINNATVGLGAGSYESLMTAAIGTASSGEKVFCGPVDDPFFVDLGGAFDLGGFRPNGPDGLEKFNCHSIVLEVPISTLQKDGKNTTQAANILDGDFVIGVYASAFRPKITTLSGDGGKSTVEGNWIQVSRLGMPLTNEVIIPVGQKDKWNGTSPTYDLQFSRYFRNPELALYMDDSRFGGAVPGLSQLRIQSKSLGAFDFRNGKKGLWALKGTAAVEGTALDDDIFGTILLPNNQSPRAVDLLPIFYTGVPNLRPYQLATGKNGDPLAAGKPFINNFLPTLGDYLRLNMAVPVTDRNSADFSSLGIIQAAVLGLTDSRFNMDASLQFIPNMDGFPNGRRLEDDVTTIELQAVAGVALAAIGLWYDDYKPGISPSPVTQQLLNVLTFNAGVTQNDTTFKDCFPYQQTPWAGFRGEGYVAPHSSDPNPMMLVEFDAEKLSDDVLLTWQIETGKNNVRYDVEHSLDGSRFTRIGSLAANDAKRDSYRFTHSRQSVAVANFYRIKQVNRDGKFSYSPVRTIRYGTIAGISVSPNPASNIINVNSSEQNMTVSLVDAAGRRLITQKLTSKNGQVDISKLPKGIYTVVAENGNITIGTYKLLKQ